MDLSSSLYVNVFSLAAGCRAGCRAGSRPKSGQTRRGDDLQKATEELHSGKRRT